MSIKQFYYGTYFRGDTVQFSNVAEWEKEYRKLRREIKEIEDNAEDPLGMYETGSEEAEVNKDLCLGELDFQMYQLTEIAKESGWELHNGELKVNFY